MKFGLIFLCRVLPNLSEICNAKLSLSPYILNKRGTYNTNNVNDAINETITPISDAHISRGASGVCHIS